MASTAASHTPSSSSPPSSSPPSQNSISSSLPNNGAAITAFDFPSEYHFPPFFTLQTNLSTRHAQLTKWAALVLDFARCHRLFRLSPSAAATNPAHPAAPLFHNPRLARRLSGADARHVLDFMRREGRAEPVTVTGNSSGSGGSLGGVAGGAGAAGAGAEAVDGDGSVGDDAFWVYWRTPDEWAALVEAWVDQTGQRGSVLTVYELTEGDSTEGTAFHGMDPDLLLKLLNVVVKRGKAQIFGSRDSLGIKFF